LDKEINTDFNCSELALNSILNSSLNCGNLNQNLGKLNKLTKGKHTVVEPGLDPSVDNILDSLRE
jgi:hypothetical protein